MTTVAILTDRAARGSSCLVSKRLSRKRTVLRQVLILLQAASSASNSRGQNRVSRGAGVLNIERAGSLLPRIAIARIGILAHDGLVACSLRRAQPLGEVRMGGYVGRFLAGAVFALVLTACGAGPGEEADGESIDRPRSGQSAPRDTIQLTDNSDDVAALRDQLDEVLVALDDVTDQLDQLDSRVYELETPAADLDMMDVQSRLDDLESQLYDTDRNVTAVCDWLSWNADGFYEC